MKNLWSYIKLRLSNRWGRFRYYQIWIRRYRQQIFGLLVLFVIALLESTLFNSVRIFNVKPDAILAALILYLMRVHVYKRKSIPTTPGKVNTLLTGGSFVWIGIQAVLYAYVAYVMLKD